MPIENIPAYVMLSSALVFNIAMVLDDYKVNRRDRVAARAHRAEVHRRAMAAIAAGKRERANKCVGRYHGLV